MVPPPIKKRRLGFINPGLTLAIVIGWPMDSSLIYLLDLETMMTYQGGATVREREGLDEI